MSDWVWLVLWLVLWIGFLCGCAIALPPRHKVTRPQVDRVVEHVAHGCQHTSVPWPVISGGDLVAWLCDECQQERPTFRCPPIRRRVVCEHPNYAEVRTWGSGVIERLCPDCGQRQMFADDLHLHFEERGEHVPFMPMTEEG